MILHRKIGHISSVSTQKQLDKVWLEWYELNKRIWHKTTEAGKSISFKCLENGLQLEEGDLLFEDDISVIVVDIVPVEAIVIIPGSDTEKVAIAYEIGNRHLPLYYQQEELVTVFDLPLLRHLTAKGFRVKEELRKLSRPLQTSVMPHGNQLITANTSFTSSL